MAEVKKRSYKYCMVPMCKNTVISTPDKLFFRIPCDVKAQKQWCKMMKKDNVSPLSVLYCCEDHFDIKEDTVNYTEYRIMKQFGKKRSLRLKKGVVPHIFSCQKQNMPPPVKRMAAVKRQRLAILNEVLSEYGSKDEEENSEVHEGYQCNECKGSIVRFRYVCVQCPDYDLCAECEGRGVHASHYVLRVPGLRPHAEIRAVLEAIENTLSDTDHRDKRMEINMKNNSTPPSVQRSTRNQSLAGETSKNSDTSVNGSSDDNSTDASLDNSSLSQGDHDQHLPCHNYSKIRIKYENDSSTLTASSVRSLLSSIIDENQYLSVENWSGSQSPVKEERNEPTVLDALTKLKFMKGWTEINRTKSADRELMADSDGTEELPSNRAITLFIVNNEREGRKRHLLEQAIVVSKIPCVENASLHTLRLNIEEG